MILERLSGLVRDRNKRQVHYWLTDHWRKHLLKNSRSEILVAVNQSPCLLDFSAALLLPLARQHHRLHRVVVLSRTFVVAEVRWGWLT